MLLALISQIAIPFVALSDRNRAVERLFDLGLKVGGTLQPLPDAKFVVELATVRAKVGRDAPPRPFIDGVAFARFGGDRLCNFGQRGFLIGGQVGDG